MKFKSTVFPLYFFICPLQVIGMLFHRAETFNHIVSTTSFGGVGNKSEEIARMFISEAMELTRNLGHLDDSDRSSVYSAFSEFDSGNLHELILHKLIFQQSINNFERYKCKKILKYWK